MKTAFVHDWIAHEGGAEAVLRDLITEDNHDEGIIFTYYSTQTWRRVNDRKYRIVTALPRRLNNRFITCNTRKFIVLSTLFDYRNLMFWFPLLTKMLRIKARRYAPDKIIISSFAAVKNIVPVQKSQSKKQKLNLGSMNYDLGFIKTTLYLHSPMQYIWENYHDNIQKLKFPIKQIYQLASKFLRPWDKTKRTYDDVYFNSEYTEAVAEKLYGMKGIVKYPPLDKAFNTSVITNDVHNYFIFVGRIVRYVREIDKIIHLFNATKEHLIIVGDGPDMGYAQSIAGPTIIFTGRVDDADEKKKLLEHARGLINISKESFGLVTAEALCAGVPVLGYNGGATAYLVNESNGYLVNEKDERSLMLGFDEFISMSFDREKISEDAQEKFFD